MTDLDDICTFLEKVHTVATAEHWPDVGNVDDIVDGSYQKIFVNTPEIIGTDDHSITKRYKVEISETGEATLDTALNNIMIGIKKFNGRQAITGWVYATYPTMCHMKIARGGIVDINAPDERSKIEIWIDIIWSTS